MARVYELKINNFRGIKSFSQKFNKHFNCILGRGDSCKTTILDAISYVLSPSWNPSFYDSDFYGGNPNDPIVIEASLVTVPHELINEDKYGLYIRGLDNSGNIQDEVQTDHEKIMTVRLEVGKDLEPQWYVISNRQDPMRMPSADRAKLNVFMVSDYIDRHFSWSKGNPLYAILKELPSAAEKKNDVIIEALREAKEKIDQESFSQFNDVTDRIKKVSSNLGIDLSGAKTTIDFRDVTIKDGRVCLHDGDVPLRLKGKGTKRLISIAIQTILVQQGGIMLIDEVEQGLEPDRVKHLVRSLKKDNPGQIFITTHSSEAITELDINDLIIINNLGGIVTASVPNQDFQKIIRACPEAGFAKKVIVCEGKTEIGICRALDSYRKDSGKEYLSVKDCVYVSGEGSSFTDRALKLKDFGKDVAVFCDSDDSNLNPSKGDLTTKAIKVFDCETNKSIEEQTFNDLPWDGVKELLLYKEKEISEAIVLNNIKSKYGNGLPDNWKDADAVNTRLAIGKAAKDGKWFKRIDYGEFLGSVILRNFGGMNNKKIKEQLENLSNWVDT